MRLASLPGAAMKKSSGYGSALSLARAISVSARAGDSGSLGCGSGQPTASGRWVSLACSQSSAAATSPQRTSSQRHSRLSGVAAFFQRLRQPEGAVDGRGEALPALQQRISFCQ